MHLIQGTWWTSRSKSRLQPYKFCKHLLASISCLQTPALLLFHLFSPKAYILTTALIYTGNHFKQSLNALLLHWDVSCDHWWISLLRYKSFLFKSQWTLFAFLSRQLALHQALICLQVSLSVTFRANLQEKQAFDSNNQSIQQDNPHLPLWNLNETSKPQADLQELLHDRGISTASH